MFEPKFELRAKMCDLRKTIQSRFVVSRGEKVKIPRKRGSSRALALGGLILFALTVAIPYSEIEFLNSYLALFRAVAFGAILIEG